MSTVLVGLDGSRAARVAFHAAVQEAQWRNISLTVYHSVFVPMVLGKRFTTETHEQIDEYGHYVLDRELAALTDTFDGKLPVEVQRVVWPGHVGEGLIEVAHDEDRGVELVVLGTRGLGGFSSLLLGSVTTYAVNHLHVPLLIVPVDAADLVDPDEELSVL
jgi:nucleotide-binding universal stress UspA family protein